MGKDASNREFLFGRLDYERSGMPRRSSELRLRRMRRLLRMLGDPHTAPAIVHVAGTKGKGSTSAMIAAALAQSGRRTGLFSSPHLDRVEERFRIDGVAVDSAGLDRLIDCVRPIVEELDRRAEKIGGKPTFFEITTAMGFLHFAREGAEAAVIEVGLGGRLDSTNAIRPAVALITNISFDHTKQLGNTLESIAFEKAGIIKRGALAVSSVRKEGPRRVIEAAAERRRAVLRSIDRDFTFEYEPPPAPVLKPAAGAVSCRTWSTDWGRIELPLLGPHQAANAASALAALDALAEKGIAVSRRDVELGFAKLKWPARVEVVPGEPRIVIDGAHNVASAEALVNTLLACFPASRRVLVFGTTRDKDAQGQLAALLPLFDVVIATRYLENPRSVPPEEIARLVRVLSDKTATIATGPAVALTAARAIATPRDLVCVTGSLFLAAETRAVLRAEGRLVAPD